MSKNRKYAPYPIAVSADGYHAKYPEIADAQPSDPTTFPRGSVAYPMLEYGAKNIYTESLYGAKNGEDWGVAPTSSWGVLHVNKQVKPPNCNRIGDLASKNLIDLGAGATIESIPQVGYNMWKTQDTIHGATILDATVRSSYILGVFANMGGLLGIKFLGIDAAKKALEKQEDKVREHAKDKPALKNCGNWSWWDRW